MNFIYQKKSLERIPQFVYQMSVGVNLIRDRPLTFSNSAFKNVDLIIDFTEPKCTLEILKIASNLKIFCTTAKGLILGGHRCHSRLFKAS